MTIYCIIARDPKSHDEWVMPKTFDTILETAEYAETCRTEDPRFRYRIENVGPSEKLTLNERYGRYAATDSMREPRTGDFTVGELFPEESVDSAIYTVTCVECLAEIKNVEMHLEGHSSWHNKLLP